MTTRTGTLGRYLTWFLASFSLGAGVIHFGVAGGHFDVHWAHGTFFAVVAWLQIAWAAAIVVRPTVRLLGVAAAGNLGVIAVWFVSRVWGVPVGPEHWVPEPVSLADALTTGFQAAIVLTTIAVLARPALARQAVRPSLGLAALGSAALAVAGVSTLALAPSFASDHHGHQAEAAAHDHQEPATLAGDRSDADAAPHDDGHDHDDGHGGHTGYTIAADGTSACEESGVTAEGNSGHGHRGPVPFEPLSDDERKIFAEQVAQANQAVADHPTVADAEAAGYRMITPYVPCIGAHYINQSYLVNGRFDPSQPEIILYTGTDPDSEVVGLSYLQFGDDEPEGFAGDNDPWHVHEFLCIGGGTVVGDEDLTEEECTARGGNLIPLGNLWMNHMWNVPGWESRWGLFSSEHPDLGGTILDING